LLTLAKYKKYFLKVNTYTHIIIKIISQYFLKANTYTQIIIKKNFFIIKMRSKTNFSRTQKEKEVEKIFIPKQHLFTKFCTSSKYNRN